MFDVLVEIIPQDVHFAKVRTNFYRLAGYHRNFDSQTHIITANKGSHIVYAGLCHVNQLLWAATKP